MPLLFRATLPGIVLEAHAAQRLTVFGFPAALPELLIQADLRPQAQLYLAADALADWGDRGDIACTRFAADLHFANARDIYPFAAGNFLGQRLQVAFNGLSNKGFGQASPLAVCHNRRIYCQRVFEGWAERGKTTMGWFYGFKLHLIVNHEGEIIAFTLTAGHVDDRTPVPELIQSVFGKLFGDKGYLSQPLRDDLRDIGIALITSIRRNMQPQLMPLYDKRMLKRRSILETTKDQLKNISQIEDLRHRSVNNFFVNLVAGLIAYYRRHHKLSVQLDPKDYRSLAAVN